MKEIPEGFAGARGVSEAASIAHAATRRQAQADRRSSVKRGKPISGNRRQMLRRGSHTNARQRTQSLTVTISWNFGAGEGIRTLDPNLGKVVLYP